ncbi:MAG: ribonuclease P protein component [Candidatus Humimicrobiaceae bacterium]
MQRLKKNWEFKRVYRKGRTVVSRNIVLYYCPNNLDYNRIGFSISKKVGKSVVRNRIRRVYREAFRVVDKCLQRGYDFILIARKPAVDVSFDQASKELYNLCRKKQLLAKKQ